MKVQKHINDTIFVKRNSLTSNLIFFINEISSIDHFFFHLLFFSDSLISQIPGLKYK
jgi:hypothetical protein